MAAPNDRQRSDRELFIKQIVTQHIHAKFKSFNRNVQQVSVNQQSR